MSNDADLAEWLLNHPDQLAALRTLYPNGIYVYKDPYDGLPKALHSGTIRYPHALWVDADNPKPPNVSYVNIYGTGEYASGGFGNGTLGEADKAAERSPASRVGMIAVYDDGIEIVHGGR